jgi:hypothetical protein
VCLKMCLKIYILRYSVKEKIRGWISFWVWCVERGGATVEVPRRYAQHKIEVLPGAGVGRQWRRRLSRPILE